MRLSRMYVCVNESHHILKNSSQKSIYAQFVEKTYISKSIIENYIHEPQSPVTQKNTVEKIFSHQPLYRRLESHNELFSLLYKMCTHP